MGNVLLRTRLLKIRKHVLITNVFLKLRMKKHAAIMLWLAKVCTRAC